MELIIKAENVIKGIRVDVTLQSQSAQGMCDRGAQIIQESSIVVQLIQ